MKRAQSRQTTGVLKSRSGHRERSQTRHFIAGIPQALKQANLVLRSVSFDSRRYIPLYHTFNLRSGRFTWRGPYATTFVPELVCVTISGFPFWVIVPHRIILAVYTVLVTPEGDTNGVFVTSKSPQGFEVRENNGGRATVGFGYRIVAKPFDTKAARLPLLSTIPRLKAFDAPAEDYLPHVHIAPTNGIR